MIRTFTSLGNASCVDGIGARLYRCYGATPFAVKMWLLYFPGEVADVLMKQHALNESTGRYAFASPQDKPCSRSWYERKGLTYRQREAREVVARIERGEQFGVRRAG